MGYPLMMLRILSTIRFRTIGRLSLHCFLNQSWVGVSVPGYRCGKRRAIRARVAFTRARTACRVLIRLAGTADRISDARSNASASTAAAIFSSSESTNSFSVTAFRSVSQQALRVAQPFASIPCETPPDRVPPHRPAPSRPVASYLWRTTGALCPPVEAT